jgi:hypothetical protein
LFDRFIAASGRSGTAGFLIYVADAAGYLSSVALLIFYNFVGVRISWVKFLTGISYTAAIGGLVLIAGAGLYFQRRLIRETSHDPIVEPDGHPAPLHQARGT